MALHIMVNSRYLANLPSYLKMPTTQNGLHKVKFSDTISVHFVEGIERIQFFLVGY